MGGPAGEGGGPGEGALMGTSGASRPEGRGAGGNCHWVRCVVWGLGPCEVVELGVRGSKKGCKICRL